MEKNLKEYFPMIRKEQEILEDIEAREELRDIFYGWSEKQQRQFLDFCTGVRGVRVLNDAFFKEILNPESAPWRLNELLSLLLGRSVTIVQAERVQRTRSGEPIYSSYEAESRYQTQVGSITGIHISTT